jgi:hypothetical protein
MKIEYKIKGSNDICSAEVDCRSMPSINVVVDGVTVLTFENVDIESVMLSDFVNNFNQ